MNFRRFQALTFDCYGTLIDWERGLSAALEPWLKRSRLTLSHAALLSAYGEEEGRIQNETPKALYPAILSNVLKALGRRFGAPVSDSEAEAFARSIRDWPPFPDSPAALAKLKKRFKLAIVSNVDRESFRHSNVKLGVEFDLVVTAQDVGAYKPNPAHFHEALRRLAELGIPKERVLHVAQSLYHDHVPAKALGLSTVWVDRRHGQGGGIAARAPVEPDWTVLSLSELVDLIG